MVSVNSRGVGRPVAEPPRPKQTAQTVNNTATRITPPSTSFQPGSQLTSRGPDLQGGTPPPTTLQTEVLGDGQANCIEQVAQFLSLDPQIRSRSEVVFLRDTRTGAEGRSGHVLIRQGNNVYDPATRQWTEQQSYFRAHPEYQLAGTASGTVVNRLLQIPPGPERNAALARSGLDPALFTLAVADTPTTGTGRVSGPAALTPSPATLAAMETYQAHPSEANFNAFVQALAADQMAAQDAGLVDAQGRLAGGDLGAWANLATAAAEATQLANFLANAPRADAMLASSVPQLRALAATLDPSLANVTVEQVLADPALAARLRDTALTVAQAQYANPRPDGTTPRADQNLSAFLDFDFAYATVGPNGYAAQGLTLEQATAMARTELAELTAGYPELSVLDEGQLISTFFPANAQLGLAWSADGVGGRAMVNGTNWADGDPTRGQYLLMQNVSRLGTAGRAPFLDTIATGRAEIATVRAYLAAGQNLPTARDLRPMAMVATQLLGTRLGNADATQADYQAFSSAFGLLQQYAREDQERAVRDAVIGGATFITGVGFTIATGGFGAPVAASWVVAGYGAISTGGMLYGAFRRVENFSTDSYRSQFAGGGMTLSNVPRPDALGFGLGMAFDALGIALQGAQLAHAMELFSTSRALQGLEGLDDASRLAAVATLFPEGTPMAVLAEIADGSRGFSTLSTEAKTLLAQWSIMTDDAYAAMNLGARADDLLQVFRETMLKGRSVEAAMAAGDITAEQAALWFGRPSSRGFVPPMFSMQGGPALNPADLAAFRAGLRIPPSVPDAVVQQFAGALRGRFGQFVDFDAGGVLSPRDGADFARNIQRTFACGDIADISASLLQGGQRVDRGFSTTQLFFDTGSGLQEIATGGDGLSLHSYAVAGGMVWDPITGVFGTMTEAEYLAHLVDSAGNVVPPR